MLKKIGLILISILCITDFSPLEGTRHARTKKREVPEKYTVKKEHTLDLAEILSRQTKDLTFEQAKVARDYYHKEKNDEMVIKCDQRILAVGGDQEIMREARLELASLFLEKKNYKEAEKYALEYQKYYPGALETKKAAYITLRANYLAKLSSDRDQEKTRATVTLAHEFLEKYKEDTDYTSLIDTMLDDCYKSLIRTEIRVIETQLNSYHYTGNEISLHAAEKRLAYIQETLLPHTPFAQKKIALLEREIKNLNAKKSSSQSIATEKKETAPQEDKSSEIVSQSKEQGYIAAIKDFFSEDNDEFFKL